MIYQYSLSEIKAALAKSPVHRLELKQTDDKFVLLDKETTAGKLREIGLQAKKWKADVSDCDKFSFAEYGLAGLDEHLNGCFVVVDYSGGHSYNAVLYCHPSQKMADGRPEIAVDIWEPQSGEFVAAEKVGKHPYSLQYGFILG